MNQIITFGKKLLIAMMFLLGLSLLLFSCKKDNDNLNDGRNHVLYLQTNDFNENQMQFQPIRIMEKASLSHWQKVNSQQRRRM